jgi:hypothetical protein
MWDLLCQLLSKQLLSLPKWSTNSRLDLYIRPMRAIYHMQTDPWTCTTNSLPPYVVNSSPISAPIGTTSTTSMLLSAALILSCADFAPPSQNNRSSASIALPWHRRGNSWRTGLMSYILFQVMEGCLMQFPSSWRGRPFCMNNLAANSIISLRHSCLPGQLE